MGQVKSITCSELLNPWRGVRLIWGFSRANCREAWVRDIRAIGWDWYSHHTLPITGKCNMVTCRDSKEAQSSWAPRGMLMGQSTCSGGGSQTCPPTKGKSKGVPGVFIRAQGQVPLVAQPLLALMQSAYKGWVHWPVVPPGCG